MERWSNRVAIVTGAGSGIGAATAALLAANGLRVVAVDLDLSRVEAIAKDNNGEIHAIQCDATNEEDVVRVVKWTRETLGGGDVLVNCAGICPLFSLIEADAEKIRKIMDVNVVGTCLFNREVVKDMRDRNVNDGHLFNICSVTGQSIIDFPGIAIYAGSKHTIRNISPGLVGTNIFSTSGMTAEEIGALMKENTLLSPDDVAQAMLYALGTPPHVQATVKQNKGAIHPIQCDVAKEEDVVRVIKWTRENLGGADVLINSAGIAPLCSLIDVEAEKIRKIMDVNVVGTCLFNREVVKDMRDRNVNDGHLFNICSTSGQSIIDHPDIAIYAGSKHTIRVMSEYLRRELRDLGTKIRITNISPGTVDTNISGLTAEEMETLKKDIPMLNPEDVAQAILYALGTPPHVQVHEISIKPIGEKY
ncbi:hypothetical protein B566_EDAN000888 [Ephemera danica]|nr:hypothetical protein B566_EDAN000888 [Ephemera danica]